MGVSRITDPSDAEIVSIKMKNNVDDYWKYKKHRGIYLIWLYKSRKSLDTHTTTEYILNVCPS